ncbi:hypothetical protein [Halobacteriovorax sp. HLS]|uniref:hypothetical protein n=1 Tax=Halobacteriovorax sp. HLS TaxID=2234000 RepID=UPI000FD772F8|nr:hypothetical protein [Halobacteriovorax sp. HLS]
MDKLNQLISYYDWNVMLKIIFSLASIGYVFFWKKLDKYTDQVLGIPFIILMSYFLFNATNLISLIFFIESALILKEIIFKVDYKRFESYFFNFARFPLWLISIYCYYTTFATFEFVDIVERTDFKLSIVYTNTLLILALLFVGFLYRIKFSLVTKSERIALVSILLPTIAFKLIYFLASIDEFILPEHSTYISTITFIISSVSFILSLRYLNRSKTRDSLILGFTSLFLLSFLPLLVSINRIFWEDYQFTVVRLILLLCVFHVFLLSAPKNRVYQLGIFLLMTEIVGLSPLGHIYKYFAFSIDSYDQIISIIGLSFIYIGIGFVAKSIVSKLSNEC